MGSIRALRSRRDVGTVAGCLESREVSLRGLCEHGRHRGHERARSKVAALAVRVIDAPAIASIVRNRHDLAAGQVLVLVMAEMLLGQSTRLVRAVRRSRGPDHLERHHAQQEDENPATHIFLCYTNARLSGDCFCALQLDGLAQTTSLHLVRAQSTGWGRTGVDPQHDRAVMWGMAPPDLVAPTPAPAAAWTHRVDLRGRRRASRCTHTRTPAAKPRSTAPPDTKQPPSTAHP